MNGGYAGGNNTTLGTGSVGGGRGGGGTGLPAFAPEQHQIDQNVREAEARLAARRRARAEARAARMKLLDAADDEGGGSGRPRNRDVRAASIASASSRRSSDAESEFGEYSREDLEDQLRKALVMSHQLDSEKQALNYMVETLRDDMEELMENMVQLRKKLADKIRAFDQQTRDFNNLQQDKSYLEHQISERDRLIGEHGLVLVGEDEGQLQLLSKDMSEVLRSAGEGNLEKKLQSLAEEKTSLEDEVTRLREELREERARVHRLEDMSRQAGGRDTQAILDAQREASKIVSDYKYRLKRAEQEVTTLSSQAARLDTQLKHYKSQAELSEKAEEELKAEKRKILRELREAQARIDELETSNSHLQKRMDKLKTARSQILSEAARDTSPPPI